MQDTHTALAPAAGAGIGKILADRLLADPDFEQLMVDAAKDGLRATRSFSVGRGGGATVETEPDFRTRIQAFTILMAHMEGEPIKRIVHQHVGNGGVLDPLAALQDSPALRDAARRLLEKSEFRTRNVGKTKRAKAEGGESDVVEV